MTKQYNYLRFLLFELFYKFFLSFAIFPLLTNLFTLSLEYSGINFFTYDQLPILLTKPLFWLSSFFIIVIICFLLLFEFAVIVNLIHLTNQDRIIKTRLIATYSFWQTWQKLKSKNFLMIIFYTIFCWPLLSIFYDSSVFNGIKIPTFITDSLNSPLLLSGLIVLNLIIFVIAISGSFMFHFFFLKKQTIQKSLLSSHRLIINNKKLFCKTIISIVLFYLLIELLGLTIKMILSGTFWLSRSPMINFLPNFIFSFLLNLINILIASLEIFCCFYFLEKMFFATTHTKNRINISLQNISKIKYFWLMIVSSMTIVNAFYSFQPIKIKINFTKPNILTIAHRAGGYQQPENSLEAVKWATKHNFMIEIDAQITKDNQIVLFHDKNLKRFGHKAKITDLNFEDLQKLSLKQNLKIPTLKQVLNIAHGKIKVNIEIKNYQKNKQLIVAVNNLIKSYPNYTSDFIITSLDYHDLQAFKQLNPQIKTGLIMPIAINDYFYLDQNIDIFIIENNSIKNNLIDKIHQSNKKIFAWTINDEDAAKNLLKTNIDGIITDYPVDISDLIKSQKSIGKWQNLIDAINLFDQRIK